MNEPNPLVLALISTNRMAYCNVGGKKLITFGAFMGAQVAWMADECETLYWRGESGKEFLGAHEHPESLRPEGQRPERERPKRERLKRKKAR
jgi:hypothetical protein